MPLSSPAAPSFSLLSCPLSPRPPSPVGKGETFSLFRRGLPPPAPRALDRLRHLQSLPSGCPAQREVHGLPPEWQEMLSFGQSRQPRRGGTGGDGTIRRKRRRRLRWSSPPGQGEQMPQGEQPPSISHSGRASKCRKGSSPPAGTCLAGSVSAANGLMPGMQGAEPLA